MEQSRDKKQMYIRWFFIRLALVVFDIFAVNAAYFSALVVRFYVASEFNVWAVKYIPAFAKFAPIYTICCLIVFFAFKLYNSRWKYAGLNDMNRILAACVVTFLIQVVGSIVLVMRMPVTYYLIGAVIQFTLIAISRFSYRFFLVERDRARKRKIKTSINVMVVGVGETCRIVLKHLERDSESAAKPVCLVDFRGNEFGNMLEGIPMVSGIENIADAVKKYNVESIVLADAVMPVEVRKQIREICQGIGVDVQDFSGYFQSNRGAISLRNLLEYAKGPVELVINDKRQDFSSGEEAMLSLNGKYVVSTVSARDNKLVIVLQKDVLVPNDVKEEWVQDYKKETGEDISFF